ncbi:hypothetical protein KIPB_001818 [Kipferlia bialata]|uniref:EGF-like domain-containing protein n=1 Tax=Kipferlia bialata TaxID=797122 RepID=A0A9K3GFJ9_9EUKA|nr:hypothetical protein KIPB_001818 [Kipferlia bialata]|eukprot:g1818.t1
MYGNGISGLSSVVATVSGVPSGADIIGPYTLSPFESTDDTGVTDSVAGEYTVSTSDFSELGAYTVDLAVEGTYYPEASGTIYVSMSPDNSHVDTGEGEHDPDSNLDIKVRVMDACGNLNESSAIEVALIIVSHPSNASIPVDEIVLTQSDVALELFEAESTYFVVAGEYKLRLRIDDLEAEEEVTLTVGTGAVMADRSEINAPSTAVAGVDFEVSIQLLDAHGNSVSSQVYATMANDEASISVALEYDAVYGFHTGSLSSSAAGNLVVGVTVYDEAVEPDSFTSTVVVSHADAYASSCALSLSETTLTAGDSLSVSLTLVDVYLNPITDLDVQMFLSGCDVSSYLTLSAAADSDVYTGTFDDLYTSCATGLTPSLSVDYYPLTGVPGSQSMVKVYAGDLLSVEFLPQSSYVAGTEYTLSAEFTDAYGNAVSVDSPVYEYSGCSLTTATSIDLTFDEAIQSYTSAATVFAYACDSFTGSLYYGSGDDRVEHSSNVFEVVPGAIDYDASYIKSRDSELTDADNTFAAGEDILFRVVMNDAQHNRIDTVSVTISITSCEGTVSTAEIELADSGSGVYRHFHTVNTACATWMAVSAKETGTTGESVSLDFFVQAGTPTAASSSLTLGTSQMTAGEETSVYVSYMDDLDNPTTSLNEVTLSVSAEGQETQEVSLSLVGTLYEGYLQLTVSGVYTLSVSGSEDDLPALSETLTVVSGVMVPNLSVVTVTSMTADALVVLVVCRDQYYNVCTEDYAPDAMVGSPVWTRVGDQTVYEGTYDISQTTEDSVIVSLMVFGSELPSVEIPLYSPASTCLECDGEDALCYDDGSGDAACLCPPSLTGTSCTTPIYTTSPLAFAYAPSSLYLPESVTEVYPFQEMPLLPSLPSEAYVSEGMYSVGSYDVVLEAGYLGTLSVPSSTDVPSSCSIDQTPTFTVTCPISGNAMSAALQQVQLTVSDTTPFAQEVDVSATVSWVLDGDQTSGALSRTVMSSGIDLSLSTLAFDQEVVPGATLSSGSVTLQYHDGTPYATSHTVSLNCAGSEDDLLDPDSYTVLNLKSSVNGGTYELDDSSITLGASDFQVVCKVVINTSDGWTYTSPKTVGVYVDAGEPEAARTLVTYSPALLTSATELSIRAVLRDASFIPVYDDSHTVVASLDGVDLGSLTYTETSSGVGVWKGTLPLTDVTLTANTAMELVVTLNGEAGQTLPVYVYTASSDCSLSCGGTCVAHEESETPVCLEDSTPSETGLYAFPQLPSEIILAHGSTFTPLVSSPPMLSSIVDALGSTSVRSADAEVTIEVNRKSVLDYSAVDTDTFTVTETYTSTSHTLVVSGTPETIGYALSQVVLSPSVQSPLGGSETVSLKYVSGDYSVSSTITVVTPSLDTSLATFTLSADPTPGDSLDATLSMVYDTDAGSVFTTLFDVSALCGSQETTMTYNSETGLWESDTTITTPTDSDTLSCVVYVGGYDVLEVEKAITAGDVDLSMSVANLVPETDGTVTLSLYLRDTYGNLCDESDLDALYQYGTTVRSMTYTQDTTSYGHYESSLTLGDDVSLVYVSVGGVDAATVGPLPAGPTCSDLDCGENGMCVTDGGESVCRCSAGYNGDTCEVQNNVAVGFSFADDSVEVYHDITLMPFQEAVAILPVLEDTSSLLESAFRSDLWTLSATATEGALSLDSEDSSFPSTCSLKNSASDLTLSVTCDAAGIVSVGQLVTYTPPSESITLGGEASVTFNICSAYHSLLSTSTTLKVVTKPLDTAELTIDSVAAGASVDGVSLSLLYADETPVTAFTPSLQCIGCVGTGSLVYSASTGLYTIEADALTAPSTSGSVICVALVEGAIVATGTMEVTSLTPEASLTSVYAETLMGLAGDTVSVEVSARDSLLNTVCAGSIYSELDGVVTAHSCDTDTLTYTVDVEIPRESLAGSTLDVSLIVLGDTVVTLSIGVVDSAESCFVCDDQATCAAEYDASSTCVCYPGSTGVSCSKTLTAPFTVPKLTPYITIDRLDDSLSGLSVASLLPAVSNPSFDETDIAASTKAGAYVNAERWDRMRIKCPSDGVATLATLPDAVSEYVDASVSGNIALVSASGNMLPVAARSVTCAFPDTDPADAPKTYTIGTTLSYAYQYFSTPESTPDIPTVYTDLSTHSMEVIVTHTPSVSAADSIFDMPTASVVGGIVTATVSLMDEAGLPVVDAIDDDITISCPSACEALSMTNGVMQLLLGNVYSIEMQFSGECSGECTAYIGSDEAGSAISIEVTTATYVAASTDVTISPLTIFADGTVTATAQLRDEAGDTTTSSVASVQFCVGLICTDMAATEGVYSGVVEGADLDGIESRGSLTNMDVYVTVDGTMVSYLRKLTVLQPVSGSSETECTDGTAFYQSRSVVLADATEAETVSLEGCLADTAAESFSHPVLAHLMTMQEPLFPLYYAQLDGTLSDDTVIDLTMSCTTGSVSLGGLYEGVTVRSTGSTDVTVSGAVEDVYTAGYNIMYSPALLADQYETGTDTLVIDLGQGSTCSMEMTVLYSAPTLDYQSVSLIVPPTVTAGESVSIQLSMYDEDGGLYTYPSALLVHVSVDGVSGTVSYDAGVYSSSLLLTTATTATVTVSVTELVGEFNFSHTSPVTVTEAAVSPANTLVWLDAYAAYPSDSVGVYVQLRDAYDNVVASPTVTTALAVSSPESVALVDQPVSGLSYASFGVGATAGVTKEVVVTLDGTPLPSLFVRVLESSSDCEGCSADTGMCAPGEGQFGADCVCDIAYGGPSCNDEISSSVVGFGAVRNGLTMDRTDTFYPVSVSPIGVKSGITDDDTLSASTSLSLSVCAQAGTLSIDASTPGLTSSDDSESGCLTVQAELVDMPGVAAAVAYVSTVDSAVLTDTYDRFELVLSKVSGKNLSKAKMALQVTFTVPTLDPASAVLALETAAAGEAVSGTLSLSAVGGDAYIYDDFVEIDVLCSHSVTHEQVTAEVSFVDASENWAVTIPAFTTAGDLTCSLDLDRASTAVSEVVTIAPGTVDTACLLDAHSYLVLDEEVEFMVQVTDVYDNVISDSSLDLTLSLSSGATFTATVKTFDSGHDAFPVAMTVSAHPTEVYKYSPLTLSIEVADSVSTRTSTHYVTVYDAALSYASCVNGSVVGIESSSETYSICLCDAGYSGSSCAVSHGFPLQLSGVPSVMDTAPFTPLRPFRTGYLTQEADTDSDMAVSVTVSSVTGSVTTVSLPETIKNNVETSAPDDYSLTITGPLTDVIDAAEYVVYIGAETTSYPSSDTVTVSIGDADSVQYSFVTLKTERWSTVTASSTPAPHQPVALAPNSATGFTSNLELDVSLDSVTSLYVTATLSVPDLPSTATCALSVGYGDVTATGDSDGTAATLDAVSATDSESLSLTVTCDADGTVDTEYPGEVTYCLADADALTAGHSDLLGSDMTAYTQYVTGDYAGQVDSFGTVVFCHRVSVNVADYPLVNLTIDDISTPEDQGIALSFIDVEFLPLFAEAQDDTLSLSISCLHGYFIEDSSCVGDSVSMVSLSADGPIALNALVNETCYVPDADFFGSETLTVTVSCADRDLETETAIPITITSVPEAPVLSSSEIQYVPLEATLYAMPSVTTVESGDLTVTVSVPSEVSDSDGSPVSALSIQGVCVAADGCTATSSVMLASTEYTFSGSAEDITTALSAFGVRVYAPVDTPSDTLIESVLVSIDVSVTDSDNGLSDETTVYMKLACNEGSLVLSDDLTHISGSLANVSFDAAGQYDCSDIFDDDTTTSFGTGAMCVVKKVSYEYGTGSTVTVFFGSSLTFLPTDDSVVMKSGLSVQSQTADGTGSDSYTCVLGDSVSFDVSLPDNPPTPVAIITGPSTMYKEASITLSGRESDSTGSFSRDLDYLWSISNMGNPNLSPFTEAIDLTSAYLSFNAGNVMSAGNSYTVTLTVTSVLGYSSSTSRTISVSGSVAPTLSLEGGVEQTLEYGDALSLRVRAEHPVDTQSGTIEFVWTCEDGPDCDDLADTFAAYSRPYIVLPALSFSENSEHTITVTGSYPSTDTEAISGATSVTIETPYADPEACISTASVVVNSLLSLSMTSCSEYYDSLEWTFPTSWVVSSISDDSTEVVLDISGADVDEYDVSLRATRTIDGEEYTSDTTTEITVVTTDLPLVSVTRSPSLVVVTSPVTLIGYAASSTGDDVSYLWAQTDGPSVDLTDEDVLLSETVSSVNLVLAADSLLPLTDYTFSLTVSDENGTSSSTHSFTTHAGPISGTFSVDTSVSDSTTGDLYHDEKVTVSTTGWVAISGQSPLTYAFTARLDGTTTTTTIQARSAARTACVLLPHLGDVYLGVWVYDAAGAYTFTESASPISVELRPGTEALTYVATLADNIVTSNETGDTDVSICTLMAASAYLDADEDAMAYTASTIASTITELPTEDLLSSSSVQIAALQALDGVASTLDNLSLDEADSLGELLDTMSTASNTDSSFLESSLSTADSLFARVKDDFASSEEVAAMAKDGNIDYDDLETAERVGVRVLNSLETMATSVASSLVGGQRAVTGTGSDVSYGAQALTSGTASEIDMLDGAASFSLPSGFSDAIGSTTGGDTYMSLVSMNTPPMGGNSTTFYSSMASITMSDDDGSLDVSDLEDPVGITIPLDSIPDLDSLISLNATLLVKSWNGTDWTEDGITTYGWDNTTAYLTAYTTHFTSFTSFFTQFGITVNTIDTEDIPELLASIDDNMTPVMLLGACASVYIGLMIALNYASVSDKRLKAISDSVFNRNKNKYESPFDPVQEGMFGPTTDDDWACADTPAPTATLAPNMSVGMDPDSRSGSLSGLTPSDPAASPPDAESVLPRSESVVVAAKMIARIQGKIKHPETGEEEEARAVGTPALPPVTLHSTLRLEDPGQHEVTESASEGEHSLDRDTFSANAIGHIPSKMQLLSESAEPSGHSSGGHSTGHSTGGSLSDFSSPPSIHHLDLTEIKTSKEISKRIKSFDNNKEESFRKRFAYDLFMTTLTEHEWLGLVFCKKTKNLTGPRRLTCLMIFLFGLFLASALFFRADCQEGYASADQEGLTVDDVTCDEYGYKQVIIIGIATAFIATPPSTILRYLFAHTLPLGDKHQKALTKRPNYDGKGFFHRIVLRVLSKEFAAGWAYVWYGISFAYLLTMMGLILLYALQFASTVGKNWMYANLLGIAQDALLNDPIKLIAQVLLTMKLTSFAFAPEVIATLSDFGLF